MLKGSSPARRKQTVHPENFDKKKADIQTELRAVIQSLNRKLALKSLVDSLEQEAAARRTKNQPGDESLVNVRLLLPMRREQFDGG